MKKSMKMVALALVLVMMMTCVLAGCTKPAEKSGVIAVIAKGESHAFWQAVKKGAEDAGAKYGYKVTFKGPVSEEASQIPAQKEMVQAALTNNAEALVLATIGTGFSDLLIQASEKGMPVVQFDSGIYQADIDAAVAKGAKGVVSSVATSNIKAAATAAENFYPLIKEEVKASSKYVLGIIQHDSTATGIDRTKGFKDKITELLKADGLDAKVEIIVKIAEQGKYKVQLDSLRDAKASAIYMTNEGVVKEVSDAIIASPDAYKTIKFVGYDAGTKQIQWMKETDENAKLFGSVAQDSYQIGYQAVEQAAFALDPTRGKNQAKVEIAGAWWDSKNVDEMMKKNLVYEG